MKLPDPFIERQPLMGESVSVRALNHGDRVQYNRRNGRTKWTVDKKRKRLVPDMDNDIREFAPLLGMYHFIRPGTPEGIVDLDSQDDRGDR